MTTATISKTIKPPVKVKITSNETNVVGYFNASEYPVNLSLSALGRSFPLAPNAYVLDDQQRKVNDPIFEPLCGPKMLSREMTVDDSMIGILRIARPSEIAQTSHSSNPVRSMSIDEAKRLGIISAGGHGMSINQPVKTDPRTVINDVPTSQPSLPAPDLNRSVVEGDGKRFVCSKDNKGFDSFGQLEAHVKASYPTEVDKLTAKYRRPPAKAPLPAPTI